MKIGIVGVGLIGGSFALGIKKRRFNLQVIGIDKEDKNLELAEELGLIDRGSTINDCIYELDYLILAIPVDAIKNLLPQILDKIPEKTTVVDFGSTKAPLCEAVRNHPKRSQYLAAHPIAGTEFSGPEAAFAELLEDKIMIFCEEELTDPERLLEFRGLCKNLAMRMTSMDPVEHDLHLSYVSHLSHVTSFALSSTVLEMEKDEKSIFAMAGSGFASTVRLAKSSSQMWSPIFKQNNKNLSKAIGEYIHELEKFKKALDENDYKALKEFMDRSNDIGRILSQIDIKK